MFRNKSEINKHVLGLLYKAKNENERNLKCFHIAKLYFKVEDYESVQRYISMYLSTRDDSAAAHKLLGQALEGLGQKEKALSAYTKSLKLDSDQADLISKVCELLCDKDVEFDPVRARYWSERASPLFPHSLPVLMLKEKLLTADSSLPPKDLEELLHAELKAKPTDVTVRIKLLKTYAESGRTDMAINHALEVESRQAHINCFAWYQCINNICKAYNRDNFAKCGWEFYIQWLTALDRMCLLSITENMAHSCDLSETIDCVYSLDQALYFASQCPIRTEKFGNFIKLMSTQVSYLLGILILKKTKMENSKWQVAKRFVGPLFIMASNTPFKLDQSWTSNMKETLQKILEFWVHQVHCRQVQAGHFLLCLVKENNSEKLFLDKVSHFTVGDWRRQTYEKVFVSVSDRKSSSSHFLNAAEYSKLSLKVPSANFLKPTSFVSSFQQTYFGSLHHLVWLGLRAIKKTTILEMKLHSFRSTSFKSLQFTINNLNNIGIETINQLDIDAFLYATVFCTASILEEHKMNGYSNEEKPQVFPADISSPLCTAEQAKWWSNLCTLVKGGSLHMHTNESMSDVRFSLQRGLEVVRGEGLSPILIVALARTFATRGHLSTTVEETDGCEARALHLWNIAYPMLERLSSNKSFFTTTKMNPLFDYPLKNITQQEAKSLFDEAKYNIGCHYLNTGQYEKAVEELKSLKSPHASYHLGLVYQKWSEEQVDGLHGDELTSEIRCRHVVLATKARDCYVDAKSLLRNDPKNSLHGDIENQLSEVDDLLARIEPENGLAERDNDGTSYSPTYESGNSPDGLQILTTTVQRNTRYHTSTPHRTHEQKANRLNMSEIIELLSVQQSTNQLKMQQVLEQIRLVTEKLDCAASEQRSQRNMIEGLTSRLNTFESEIKSSISDMKKDMKRPELCNMFDEDDYADEMSQYPAYSSYYTPSQRVVQNATAPPPAGPYANQFFSPRIDQFCQGFYNQQGALPFSEGQQLPDFLRQQKLTQPLLHSLQPGIPPQLNLASGIPGPSRIPTGGAPLPPNVLLTTADVLPSITPPGPSQLSVAIPINQLGVTPSNLPHNFQIPLPPQPKPILNIEERPIEEETPPPTYDPLPDYVPLVALPDEIELHTGEENEEVLFEKRSKLFRFIDKTWKERGIGNLKILKSKDTGKVRILMRRDQVHKICANHFLTSDIELQPKAETENAWIWFTNDFADEKIQLEQFCAKFKTKEDSDEFKNVFDKAKNDLDISKDISSCNQPSLAYREPTASASPAPFFNFSTNSSSASIGSFSNSFNFSNSFLSPANKSQTEQELSAKIPVVPPVQQAPTPIQPAKLGVPPVQQAPTPIQPGKLGVPAVQPAPTPIQPAKLGVPPIQQAPTPIQPAKLGVPPVQKAPTPIQPAKLGGFNFTLAQPKFKAPDAPKDDKIEISKDPSPFTKFNFGISTDAPKDSFSMLSTLCTEKKTDLPNPFAISSLKTSSSSPSSQQKSDTSKDEVEVDNFVPTATFQPVIPLPELVTVKTGEEGEEIVFEDKAQLYRYCKDTKQWKERGSGQMKILRHPDSGAYRLLMRREQVLKVCCNHRITSDINLKPMSTSDRALTWAAKDHSEEPATDELFTLRFKYPEQANKFKDVFQTAQTISKRTVENSSKAVISEKPSLSSVIKKAPGSWGCNTCYVDNKASDDVCAACSTPRVKVNHTLTKANFESRKEQDSLPTLAELLKPKEGTWECGECYVRNQPNVASCISCGKNKPGSVVSKPTESAKPAVSFTFGIPNPSEKTENKTVGFAAPSAPAFTFGTPSFGVSATPIFGSDLFKPKDTASSPFFNQGQGFTFSSPSTKPSETSVVTPIVSSVKPVFDFLSGGAQNSTNQDFSFGSPKFQFALNKPATISNSPGNLSQHDESGYDPEEEEEEENHIQFQPVVPLPDKVEVMTGEENETVLYSHRAKLYRLDNKEWKERGVGDVKILQHKDTGKIRFLMRREPILKVCLNHSITPDVELREKDDKTWLWYAVDFSDGQKNERFAIRFKTPEIAQAFKEEVDKAKAIADKPPSTTVSKQDKESSKDVDEVSSTSSDSDVVFVSEQKAPPHLEAKARSLMLPPNYYCYLNKPKCTGCRGCESDENEEDEGTIEYSGGNESSNQVEDKEQSLFKTNMFGSVGPVPTTPSFSSPAVSSKPFSFAEAFSKPNDDKKNAVSSPTIEENKGFLFKTNQPFSPMNLQKNIFLTGVTQETPAFLSAKNTSSLQSFSTLSEGPPSFVMAGSGFEWAGAGQYVFNEGQKLKEGENKAGTTKQQTEDSVEDT